jgi:L-amino acid N-acyltransferase YncA
MPEQLTIRDAVPADAAFIAAIYNHYIRNTVVTFEETEITASDMESRMTAVTASYPWLVGEAEGQVIGYAYARKYHERAAYRHTVETGIYLDHRHHGRGFGRALYEKLLALLPARNIHVAIGSISPPNPASVALHEKMGFVQVGRFPQIGFKFGQWIDVVYWHRTFDIP